MIGMGSRELDNALDRWLTTPPDEEESKCKCSECKADMYPGEKIYVLDGDIYCRDCALEWLEQYEQEVTDDYE